MPTITSLGNVEEPDEPAKPQTWEEQVSEYRVVRKNLLTRAATVLTKFLRARQSQSPTTA